MKNRFAEKLARFGRLSPADVDALIDATSAPLDFPARHDLIREGDRPGPVFVVLEGWACRYTVLPSGARQILAYLMPGDSCDLHAELLVGMDHSIQTVTPARVAMIERARMDALMENHRNIERALYIAQLADEGTMRAWITSMGRRTSTERVAHLMSELYIRARNIGLTTGSEMVLPLSQLMLADSVGMTPVHLNRVLKELRLTGAMHLSRGSLTVTDPARLARIAGFDESYLQRRVRAVA